jgi:hypothetical protein
LKRSLLKRTIVVVIPALVLANCASGAWAPTAALADLGLQNTTLTCNDGTNLALALDTADLTALTDAVNAINLYPAGDPALSCGLSQGSSSSSGNGPKDFVVGGGQAAGLGSNSDFGAFFCPGDENFSVSAHAASDAPPTMPQPGVGGTFNLTATTNKCGFSGHLVSKVDCVAVGDTSIGPGNAQLTAYVTHADGAYASLTGQEIEVDLYDSGMPNGQGDMLNVYITPPCAFGFPAPTQPVDRGNINVHDG